MANSIVAVPSGKQEYETQKQSWQFTLSVKRKLKWDIIACLNLALENENTPYWLDCFDELEDFLRENSMIISERKSEKLRYQTQFSTQNIDAFKQKLIALKTVKPKTTFNPKKQDELATAINNLIGKVIAEQNAYAQQGAYGVVSNDYGMGMWSTREPIR